MDPISSVLFTLYRGTPQHGEWIIACLEGAWPILVGERAARACRPLIFDESCLTVEITDPDWEEAIKGMKAELLDKIRTGTCGEVRQLSFRSSTKKHR
jgi:hypothetical protein